MKALMLGLVTGFDNLAVSSSFGTIGLSSRDRMKLVASFAFFEALMTVLGFVIVSQTVLRSAEWLGPVCLLISGILIALRIRTRSVVKHDRRLTSSVLLIWIPLALSLDNLAAGAGIGAFDSFGIFSAVVSGCVAATLSAGGLLLGSLASKRFRLNPHLACATCLIVLGMVGLFTEI
jgi:putative Mn2+ efflux pump MntP